MDEFQLNTRRGRMRIKTALNAISIEKVETITVIAPSYVCKGSFSFTDMHNERQK